MSAKLVNVLVTADIGAECLRQIASISPEIKVWYASDLARADEGGDFSSKEQFDELLAKAEVLYAWRLPQNVIARAPNLKWIQVMFAGVDSFLHGDIRQSSVIITNVRGMNAVPVAESVLELMLMFVKRAPLCFRLKQEKQWKSFVPAVLYSRTVGIVGLGSIGREVARLAKVFGMRVVATRKSAKKVGRARYVDVLLPSGQLRQLLLESDFVVLALPLTSETSSLIGEQELRTMKSTAYLINIARGGIVDERALIHALDEGWIAGAGLDVFATEPLPTESRLWELPNLIFSPHVTGDMEDYNTRATGLFCENLRRYLKGEKLLNVIDKKKGY